MPSARKDATILCFKSPDGSSNPIDLLVFDLDNTVYPASSPMAAEMNRLMSVFVADYLKLPLDEATAVRTAGFKRHGTTLRWLQAERGLADPDLFLEAVHPANVAELLPRRPRLREFLGSFSTPKVVLTNAPRSHAERVLNHLGIADCFDAVFDLQASGYVGKPNASAYERVLASRGARAAGTVFIDDIPEYLQGFARLGGHCILVDESGRHPNERWATVASLFDLRRHLSEVAYI